MKNYWIKLHRKITESAVWSDPVRLKAWIDILLSANYKDKDWFFGGHLIRIRKGQYITSIRKLAKSWGCSKGTVRRILDQFKEMNMIDYESGTLRYTLITVIKYGDYQGNDSSKWDSDEDSNEDSDRYTDEDTDKDSDEDSDGTQLKNKEYKKSRNKKKPSPPLGGSAPDDWTPADEDDWITTNRGNAEQLTREEFKAMLIQYGQWHDEGDDGG